MSGNSLLHDTALETASSYGRHRRHRHHRHHPHRHYAPPPSPSPTSLPTVAPTTPTRQDKCLLHFQEFRANQSKLDDCEQCFRACDNFDGPDFDNARRLRDERRNLERECRRGNPNSRKKCLLQGLQWGTLPPTSRGTRPHIDFFDTEAPTKPRIGGDDLGPWGIEAHAKCIAKCKLNFSSDGPSCNNWKMRLNGFKCGGACPAGKEWVRASFHSDGYRQVGGTSCSKYYSPKLTTIGLEIGFPPDANLTAGTVFFALDRTPQPPGWKPTMRAPNWDGCGGIGAGMPA